MAVSFDIKTSLTLAKQFSFHRIKLDFQHFANNRDDLVNRWEINFLYFNLLPKNSIKEKLSNVQKVYKEKHNKMYKDPILLTV